MDDVIERWNRIGNVLFGGNDPLDPTSADENAGLGLCVAAQQSLNNLIDRDFNLVAHRWYHTVGAPQLSLMTFVLSQAGLMELFGHRLAEDMFHMGFLAGVASERGFLLELADAENAAVCVNEASGGVRTIEMLQAGGLLPAFTDDDLAQIERMKAALRDLMEEKFRNDNGQN